MLLVLLALATQLATNSNVVHVNIIGPVKFDTLEFVYRFNNPRAAHTHPRLYWTVTTPSALLQPLDVLNGSQQIAPACTGSLEQKDIKVHPVDVSNCPYHPGQHIKLWVVSDLDGAGSNLTAYQEPGNSIPGLTIRVADLPTKSPTNSPTTSIPSIIPSFTPSKKPTASPSTTPSVFPSKSPTVDPSGQPSVSPSKSPTVSPSKSPTVEPSEVPTVIPTFVPTRTPSGSPSTSSPTVQPSASPTVQPTSNPSHSPTASPSRSPSVSPTVNPSVSPTVNPTKSPSVAPSRSPSVSPTTLASYLEKKQDYQTVTFMVVAVLFMFCVSACIWWNVQNKSEMDEFEIPFDPSDSSEFLRGSSERKQTSQSDFWSAPQTPKRLDSVSLTQRKLSSFGNDRYYNYG